MGQFSVVCFAMSKAVCCAWQAQNIAGYVPGSSVAQHNQIDLDQKAIVTQVGSYNWDAAEEIYKNGGSNAGNFALGGCNFTR